jgi:hypothetical protein
VYLARSFVDPAQTAPTLEGFERSRRHQAMAATASVGVAVGGRPYLPVLRVLWPARREGAQPSVARIPWLPSVT